MSSTAMIAPKAMRDTFLLSVYEIMLKDPNVFFVSADFGSPVLDKIRADCAERFVNVGIAEQNLINVSAGLALEGFKVFAYAIAPFITMRCFEQIRVNLGLLSEVRPMNVSLVGVGAGYSYVVSGPTHQCYEDITLMRAIPNMHVMSPADQIAASKLPEKCLQNNGPKYIRLDAQVLPVIYSDATFDLPQGFFEHQSGHDVCLLATGYMVHTALKVAHKLQSLGVSVGVVDLLDLSRFSQEKLTLLLSSYQAVVTMEEGFSARGGLDAMMFDFIARNHLNIRMLNIGVTGTYRFEIGERQTLHEQVGIGVETVTSKVSNFLKSIK
ncbi:transketolase family protein [Methylophilus sp. 3sh_L]|uniref:transketolase family protein n=1 Tax=Methylophilus sp. 3sh_L TaxID=3377114 RepID=UPI00398E9B37